MSDWQPIGRNSLTVPLHRELKRVTLRSLIWDAGTTVEEFLFLLQCDQQKLDAVGYTYPGHAPEGRLLE